MKKVFFFLIFISTISYAQHKITGTLQSSKPLEYALLYKIENMKLAFVQNTHLTNGSFQFNLPANTTSGSYRIIYDTKNNGFVDFWFHQEDVVFQYNTAKAKSSIRFEKSKENKEYQKFLTAISFAQQKLDLLQTDYLKTPTQEIEKSYTKALIVFNAIKKTFLNSTKGMFIAPFIKGNIQYNAPKIIKSSKAYFKSTIAHFFDGIDFNNKTVTNSSFFIDKINQYVFYTNASDDQKTQQELYKKAVGVVLAKTKNTTLKKNITELFIHQFTGEKNVVLVDFILENYYNKLPKEQQNETFKKETLANLAAEVGRVAPNFSWFANGKKNTLSKLNDAKNYVLVFWSTGCSHCTREIPKLYDFTKKNTAVKVIAFGMENNDTVWKDFIAPLQAWHHALGLGKWENEMAKTYQIYATPTYFVLNADKKIIAKPETLEALKKIINQLN